MKNTIVVYLLICHACSPEAANFISSFVLSFYPYLIFFNLRYYLPHFLIFKNFRYYLLNSVDRYLGFISLILRYPVYPSSSQYNCNKIWGILFAISISITL